MRSAAVTKGQIADILQARGELDEALRIYRDKVLPSLRKLGYVRETQFAERKIVDLMKRLAEKSTLI